LEGKVGSLAVYNGLLCGATQQAEQAQRDEQTIATLQKAHDRNFPLLPGNDDERQLDL
jgi:hypothetical protein